MRPPSVAVLVTALVFGAGLSSLWGIRETRRVAARRRLSPDASSPRPRLRLPDARRAVPAVAAGIGGFVVGRFFGACVGVGLAFAAQRIGSWRERRAVAGRLDEQLADGVGAIAAALRAGLSVPQALAYAANEAEPPLAGELGRLVADIEVGVPLTDAVGTWAAEVGTDDARLLGSALELHRRSGGDLPSVLDQVAATIRDRVAAAREVRALTAQARLSGLILGLLPVGFFAFLWLTSRRDIEGALGTRAGAGSIAVGLVLEAAAFVWIRRLLRVAA